MNSNTNILYAGTVTVAAFHLKPSASNFAAIMPGALRGIGDDNKEVVLQSFGMMAVELNGANGEKLQLATGKTAVINFPITLPQQSLAPQVIPLWYFNDTTGFWKKEGSATKQGNSYVGTVSHFSFWNVDVPYPLINFEAIIKDEANNDVQAKVEITMGGSGDRASISATGFSDRGGKIVGKIPANQILQLKVFSSCNLLIYTQQIGPFSTNTNLGAIKTNLATYNSTLTGSVVDCNNIVLNSGLVNVLFNGKNYRTNITNGNFSVQVTNCNAGTFNAYINAYDVVANKVSDTISLSITAGSNAVTGKITACKINVASTINFTIGTKNYAYTTPVDSFSVNRDNAAARTSADIISSNGNDYLHFTFKGNAAPGDYPMEGIFFVNNDTTYNMKQIPMVRITEYGNQQGFISGSFSGNFEKQDSTIHPMNFTFRVKRQ